ncbi:hypothetical protein [Clostridium butyricum]|uniref:hypothetical protein n=1 Tax=Clostridium butyricum TaxID=1492 RepID=UPI0014940D20|nr:hypothetical protein [Clostridium butyricum]NOW25508.1 hypothetical protein [Clostridium butyricum]
MDINKDNIDKMVEYINIELKNNSRATVNKLCDKIGVKQSTFKTWVHRAGYKFDFDNRAYTKDIPQSDNDITHVIENKTIEKNNINDNDNILVINEDMKNNLISLAQNYDKIMNLINQYDKLYDKRYDGIIIELPIESKTDYRTTIRINNVIWEQFDEFANQHSEFTKKDLLSMALKEYIEKYK